MKTRSVGLSVLLSAALAICLLVCPNSYAGSATWLSTPASGDWNTAANWNPVTVPNGADDEATFSSSFTTDLSILGTITLSGIHFEPGASAFQIDANDAAVVFIEGNGVVNDSGTQQTISQTGSTFSSGGIEFLNNSSAGQLTSYQIFGGAIIFEDTANAEQANLVITGGEGGFQGLMFFFDSASAANASISTLNNGATTFDGNSSAGEAQFFTGPIGTVVFGFESTAGNAVFQCSNGGGTEFTDFATAGYGAFTIEGAEVSDGTGSYANFSGNSTAAESSFVINGGGTNGAAGAVMTFYLTSTAGDARLTVNGGSNGGDGASLFFLNQSSGGAASITVSGNGEMDIGNHTKPGVTIGSLAGDGLVYLGSKALTIGSNNANTTFSGVMQDGGINKGTGGTMTKTGTGTLTLSGANLYTGGTTVSAGTLVATHRTGSATGTGAVIVSGGTLGGSGIISGAVTVNSGGFLAPSYGGKQQLTLTIQSSLTLNSGATYAYSFKAKGNKSKTDKVIASGVTINGATVNLQPITKGSLKAGTIYTLISNTSTSAISGTFSNLAEGAIVNVNGNNLQASYEGGDGNDLTLTVVP